MLEVLNYRSSCNNNCISMFKSTCKGHDACKVARPPRFLSQSKPCTKLFPDQHDNITSGMIVEPLKTRCFRKKKRENPINLSSLEPTFNTIFNYYVRFQVQLRWKIFSKTWETRLWKIQKILILGLFSKFHIWQIYITLVQKNNYFLNSYGSGCS